MPKLIDANEFYKALDRRGRMFMPGEQEDLGDAVPYFAERKVFETLGEQPAVDAAPVVHGRWFWADDGYCRCSECTQKAPVIPQYQDEPMTTMTDFCPHCGAKMDLKTEV